LGFSFFRRTIITTSFAKFDHLTEVPTPVLFNTWKHHAGAIRQRVQGLASQGETALRELAKQLVVIGSELMDLYTGTLTPVAIAEKVLADLRHQHRLEPVAYKTWLAASGGYGVVTFPEDGTRWVLRMGEEDGRYVHLHPGRWAVQTRRVRANVLKTAIMVHAHVAVHGGDAYKVSRINAVRQEFLDLSPIARLEGDEGLGVILKELASKRS
jgi:hypothetical protein